MSTNSGSGASPPLQPRLGPSWRSTSTGGRGFQPPSAEPDDIKNSNRNSFSLLDMDDDAPAVSESNSRKVSSRSEGLRSSGTTGGAFSVSGRSTRTPGRSLSDLASRLPAAPERSSKSTSRTADDSHESGRSSSFKEFDDKNVIRFTREKLLSMRPRVDPNNSVVPEVLNSQENSVMLSDHPQDPVCWDTFDADEIWAQVKDRQERQASKRVGTGRPRDDEQEGHNHKSSSHGEPDRWQRGVALPPADRNRTSGNNRYKEAENPDELWDDPSAVANTAPAADFSAFGGSLDDAPDSGDTFDLSAMAEAAKKFDDDFHKTDSMASNLENMETHDHKVNPLRPLAAAGTTIRSGVGDDVNVFEDFDSPNESDSDLIKSDKDQSASSKLMQMIGVSSEPDVKTSSSAPEPAASGIFTSGFSSLISSNPWGAPAPAPAAHSGLDLAAKLRDDEIRRQQQQEEERKRAAVLAQQQARQAELQKQQGYSQVELILTERISTILENSWGRSDLASVLQTIHNDDARVIPLLGSIDALRALIARHPNRFGFAKDPTFGTEMVVLVTNNAQWIQQQKADEEMKRRQLAQQQRMIATKEAEERARNVAITAAPWYYADPQRNIQGPFSGEEMRQWLEAGYFKGDLPISQNQNGPFKTLSSLFPDITTAFRPTIPSGETSAKTAAILEAEARAQAEARAAAERDAKAEAARQAKSQNSQARQQDHSNQLKMMLGLGGDGSNAVAGVQGKPQIRETVKSTSETNITLDSEPQSKLPKAKSSKTANTTKDSGAAITTPAWGGAATTQSTKKKSMSEIQKEEAKVAAAKQKATGSQPGGGWANIAASGGTTAWSGGAVAKASSVLKTGASATGMSLQSSKNPNQQNNSVVNKKEVAKQSSNTQKVLEEFGADDQMTPALESWCKEQMKKLNGSDDLTLVAFCMTLSDPIEIKQYLAAYLGSTPQVSSFAQEFINRKNGKKQQEEWETTGKSKKNRKR